MKGRCRGKQATDIKPTSAWEFWSLGNLESLGMITGDQGSQNSQSSRNSHWNCVQTPVRGIAQITANVGIIRTRFVRAGRPRARRGRARYKGSRVAKSCLQTKKRLSRGTGGHWIGYDSARPKTFELSAATGGGTFEPKCRSKSQPSAPEHCGRE